MKITKDTEFLSKAIDLVANYTDEHLDKSEPAPEYSVFVVWCCKTLRHFKALLSTTLYDGMCMKLPTTATRGKSTLTHTRSLKTAA